MLVSFVRAPKQPNMPEPKNSPQCKSPYWNKPRPAPARGDPAWLKDGAQKVV